MKIKSNTKSLNLSNSGLNHIPDEVFLLMSLETLILRGNNLTEVPPKIGGLKSLKDLDLSNNKISSIPPEISNLTNLQLLDLDNNLLKVLPEELCGLTNLKGLFLNNNRLSTIPEGISSLANLIRLSIQNNDITSIPYQVSKLEKLIELDIAKNPLENPPIEIVNKGTDAILNYLRQLVKEGIDYLYEAKLIIIGEGGAGKTTLVEKIKDSNYSLKDEDSTRGIEVTEWGFEFEKENTKRQFKVNVWDFGGQEIYHATHQFFLTKRSLYSLVADTRKEDTDFNYWLNVVELLSDKSPVVIILNEKQDRKKKLNESKLKAQFTNLLSINSTNLATNRGLPELISEIKYQICRLSHIGSELPKSWTSIRNELEKDERNHIGLKEYLEICKKQGVKDFDSAINLSGYYHDLGVFLHFRDNPVLKNTIILTPKWATEAVYKLIDSKVFVDNYGQFSKNEIRQIWHEEEYQIMLEELIELMKKFELCYQLKDSSKYIIPQLLQSNSPDYQWDNSKNLHLKYIYQFMPKGVINRLIVRLHRYIEDQSLVWKEGVILNKEETTAEILEDYLKKEISVKISGKRKRDFLIIISEELDQINETYHRSLKVEKLIPCNCSSCKDTTIPYFYKLESLQRRIDKGKKTIECDISYDDVSVKGLIDDIISQPLSKEELKNLISGGKTEEALEIIRKSLNNTDDFYNEIILQLSRLNEQKKKQKLGLQSNENLLIEKNSIELSIITLIDQIESI